MVEILQHPDPRLRQVSAEVTDFSEVADIVTDMYEALADCRVKALGLAAIQIGVAKRIVVVVLNGKSHMVMVNPRIEWRRGEQRISDGCLSVQGGTRFMIRTRPAIVQVTYQDETGVVHYRKARNQDAAVIAHEVDHLDGILFLDQLLGAA